MRYIKPQQHAFKSLMIIVLLFSMTKLWAQENADIQAKKAEEVAIEETASEEVATEEVTTEEVTTEEVTTEEVTTEEVATEEVTTEEVTTEEVATEEVATEEAATEEMATQEAVTEELATDEVVSEEVVNEGVAMQASLPSQSCPMSFNQVPIPESGKLCQIFAAEFPASMVLHVPQTPNSVVSFYQDSQLYSEVQAVKERFMLQTTDKNTTIIVSTDGEGSQVDILVKRPPEN